jgi:hypothetical protein
MLIGWDDDTNRQPHKMNVFEVSNPPSKSNAFLILSVMRHATPTLCSLRAGLIWSCVWSLR